MAAAARDIMVLLLPKGATVEYEMGPAPKHF